MPFIEMPDNIDIYNGGNNRCDTLLGFCCCGSYHDKGYWLSKFKKNKIDEDIAKQILIKFEEEI